MEPTSYGPRELKLVTQFNNQYSHAQNRSVSSFTEDFTSPNHRHSNDKAALLLSAATPAVSGPKPSLRQRLSPQKLPYRLRLCFRIVSLIASGTALASLIDVLFNFYRTRNLKIEGKEVWPRDIDIKSNLAVAVACTVCFASDLLWFGFSAKRKVRFLEGRGLKLAAIAVAVAVIVLLGGTTAYAEIVRFRPVKGRRPLFWICAAQERIPKRPGVDVDFPFWCGELYASEYARFAALGAQVALIITVFVDCCWAGRR